MDMYRPPFRSRGLLKGKLRRHGFYWLPNLITSGALFAGFYAIVQAMNGRFEQSAMAIFVAMVLYNMFLWLMLRNPAYLLFVGRTFFELLVLIIISVSVIVRVLSGRAGVLGLKNS